MITSHQLAKHLLTLEDLPVASMTVYAESDWGMELLEYLPQPAITGEYEHLRYNKENFVESCFKFIPL